MTSPVRVSPTSPAPISPIRNQPSHRTSNPEDGFDTYTSVAPYGPPVILGPILPSPSEPRTVGPQPTFMTCHMCSREIRTVIFHRPTVKTHLLACCLCIIGCWPCMCIPYCMYSCNKTDHYCPYCSAFLGSYLMA